MCAYYLHHMYKKTSLCCLNGVLCSQRYVTTAKEEGEKERKILAATISGSLFPQVIHAVCCLQVVALCTSPSSGGSTHCCCFCCSPTKNLSFFSLPAPVDLSEIMSSFFEFHHRRNRWLVSLISTDLLSKQVRGSRHLC